MMMLIISQKILKIIISCCILTYGSSPTNKLNVQEKLQNKNKTMTQRLHLHQIICSNQAKESLKM